jgi:hypothetical protein
LRYSDVAVLGKLVTQGDRWRAAGLALHTLNGAMFGLAFHEAQRKRYGRTGANSRSGWRSPSTRLSTHSAISSTGTTLRVASPGSRGF